jgi:hypothetical protein
MAEVLERLCDVLVEELERQQLLLSLLESQRKAALSHDVALLDAKTQALENLLGDAKMFEGSRHKVVRQVVEMYALPPAQQTLSDLIRALPDPYSSRLRHFQIDFRSTLYAIRDLVRNNSLILNKSLRSVESFLAGLNRLEPSASHYSAAGKAHAQYALQPALLNQRG